MNKMSHLLTSDDPKITEDLLTREDFVRTFSNRTKYNLGESREILDAFQSILEECCEKRLELRIPYMFSLTHTLIPARIGSRPTRGKKGFSEKIDIKESTRSNIKLSKNLRALSKSEIIENQEE